jgi:hypothetical protein
MISTPALRLRRYCFSSGNISDRVFSEDKFQQELYHRLKTDYEKICKPTESHHKNLDLCVLTGELMSYGEIHLVKDFIRSHPLYYEEERIYCKEYDDEYTHRGYLHVLLGSVIRLFPVSLEVKESSWIDRILEFDSWTNNNLSIVEWNEKEGRYIF